MRLYRLLTIGLILSAFAGYSESASPEKAITLINAKAVDAALLERVRAFAERELHVPVRAEHEDSLAEIKEAEKLKEAALKLKDNSDVIQIVLGAVGDDSHLTVSEDSGVAIINVPALQTDDHEKFARRIERMVMRAAAFTFGLSPTPDPFCVTRDYRSLEDLDTMGRNFSPPWQGRFAEEAAKRGLSRLAKSFRVPPELK